MRILSVILLLTFMSCKTQYLNFDSSSLNGKYIGIGKVNAGVELRLEENKEFYFNIRGKGEFTYGTWSTSNNTLILNSKSLNKMDSLSNALTSGIWITLQNSEWKINKNKLVEIKIGKWKLKKVE